MKKIFMAAIAVLSLCAVLVGCKHEETYVVAAKSTNTYVVVVGMENSKFAGSCPGAGYDADRMYKLLSQYTSNIVLFRDSNATKANVANALKSAITQANDGLVIFYYSGHGGSEPFPDTGIEETDGHDEFLCLWDTYMRDNEIWNLINKSRGRFFMLTDSCHSETQFRNPVFRITPILSFDHELREDRTFSLLCWSGCPDKDYSYGASTGGQFTNALLRHFYKNLSYEQLWALIKNDKTLRAYENPQSTVLGNGFTAKPIFR